MQLIKPAMCCTCGASAAHPHETVDIRFVDVFQLSAFALADEQELQLHGSEEDLRQRILAEPSLIEGEFRPLAVERETPAGAVDIYGTDREGVPTIIELKRRRVGPDAVSQLKRYVDALERELAVDRSVRGICSTRIVDGAFEDHLAEFERPATRTHGSAFSPS